MLYKKNFKLRSLKRIGYLNNIEMKNNIKTFSIKQERKTVFDNKTLNFTRINIGACFKLTLLIFLCVNLELGQVSLKNCQNSFKQKS